MSRFASRVGEQVDAGDQIGAIGSTGRSTGPHLHFEVHINNRAVNPRPILETAPDVLKERSEERRVGKECVSTCRTRWSPYHYKKIIIILYNYDLYMRLFNIL